jgi:hypothetical protein
MGSRGAVRRGVAAAAVALALAGSPWGTTASRAGGPAGGWASERRRLEPLGEGATLTAEGRRHLPRGPGAGPRRRRGGGGERRRSGGLRAGHRRGAVLVATWLAVASACSTPGAPCSPTWRRGSGWSAPPAAATPTRSTPGGSDVVATQPRRSRVARPDGAGRRGRARPGRGGRRAGEGRRWARRYTRPHVRSHSAAVLNRTPRRLTHGRSSERAAPGPSQPWGRSTPWRPSSA